MKSILFVTAMFISTWAFCQNQPAPDLTTAKGFVLHLIQLSKDGNKTAWAGILSEKIKERHKDNIETHFTAWSETFLALAKKYDNKYDNLKITYNEKSNTIKVDDDFNMRVIKENGQFRINEN